MQPSTRAKGMTIRPKKPFDEIFKYTLVPVERLKELAKMLSGTPARG